MKFIKNKKIGFLLIGLLCLAPAFMQAEEQLTGSESAQIEQVIDPILSEQEILQFLQAKFAIMQVAPDVNPAVVARSLSYGKLTQTGLEGAFTQVEKHAQELADAHNAWSSEKIEPIISRKDFSAIIYEKSSSKEKGMWLVYLLLVNRRAVAVHEAAHATATVHLIPDYAILDEISMIGSEDSQAFAVRLPRSRASFLNSDDEFVSYYKNYMVVAASGYLTEQIFGLPAYTQLKNFFDYRTWLPFKQPSKNFGCMEFLSEFKDTPDMQQMQRYAQILIDNKVADQTEGELLQECYDRSYQFVLEHKQDIEKIADVLMKKDVVFGEEVYELLGLQQPLYDFQAEILPVVQTIMPVAPNSTKKQKALLAAAKNKKNKKKGRK